VLLDQWTTYVEAAARDREAGDRQRALSAPTADHVDLHRRDRPFDDCLHGGRVETASTAHNDCVPRTQAVSSFPKSKTGAAEAARWPLRYQAATSENHKYRS